ncbi:MAG: hypothetical protein HKN10_19995 [Myxococcales bacterium]|nr:hypothetical protein [Myxococcales bacterium]
MTVRACSGYQGGTVFASSKSWTGAGGLVASLLVVAACTEATVGGEPREAPRAPAESKTADPYDDSPYRLGEVPLHAGFSPDPRVVSGSAVGEIPARSIHRKCRGWISETPDYLLAADTAFFNLRILVRSSSDTLLVVRKPSGAVLCNDNRSGTKDPMLRSHFPIGTTQVWIGVQDEGATADYRLGFSEVKWHSSSIPLPDTD